MQIINRTMARFKKLKKTEYLGLSLLCLMSLVAGCACTLVDISITNLFLKNQGLLSIGFDYLWTGLFLMVAGHYALLLHRRKGYASTMYMFVMTCVLWFLLLSVKTDYQEIFANLLFIYKYVFLFFIPVIIWSINTRLIKIDLMSLRFLGISVAMLFGYVLGGIIALYFKHNPFILLWSGFLTTVVLIVLIKLVSDIFSVMSEVFVPIAGGVRDGVEKKLFVALLNVAFLYTSIKFFTDFIYFNQLISEPFNLIQTMGNVWIVFALLSIVLSIILWFSQSWLTYVVRSGIYSLCFSILCLCSGIWFQERIWIYIGVIGCALLGRFYIYPYLQTLPYILSFGNGMRIRKIRWVLVEPVAVIFVGSMLLGHSSITIWILLGMGAALGILLIYSNHLYGRLLLQGCYLKRNYETSLLISYSPLKQMLKQELTNDNIYNFMYFLHILSLGAYSKYRHQLIASLKHVHSEVRKYALEQLESIALNAVELEQVKLMFQTDENVDVQNEALTVLIIHSAEDNDKMTCDTYRAYLSNKELSFGACKGLLSTRNGKNDGIQTVLNWAASSVESKKILALRMMAMKPLSEWEPWINKCLFHESKYIVQNALVAAGALGHPKLLPGILNALDDISVREYALAALQAYGVAALPTIERMILNPQCSFERRKILICFLGQQKEPEAKQVLVRVLFVDHTKLRLVAIQTLMFADFVWVHYTRKKILGKSLHGDVTRWYKISECLCTLRQLSVPKEVAETKVLLQKELQDEMDSIRRLIIYQVGLLKPCTLVSQSCDLLMSSDMSVYAGAVSCLQDLLPKAVYRLVKPVLLKQMPTLSENQPQDWDRYLSFFILNPPGWVNAWMKTLVLQAICMAKSQYAMSMLEQALKSQEWLVLDMALWGLGQCAPNKKIAQDLTLSVPTKYLLQHEFQKLLEV